MRKHYLYYLSICDWHSRLIGIWGVVENHLAAGTAKCKSSLKNMISNVKKEVKKWKGYLDFDLEVVRVREYHHQYIRHVSFLSLYKLFLGCGYFWFSLSHNLFTLLLVSEFQFLLWQLLYLSWEELFTASFGYK
jgi:hypothetical protein